MQGAAVVESGWRRAGAGEPSGGQGEVVLPGRSDESAQAPVFRIENRHCAECGSPLICRI